jgi:hypothetical protein
VTNQDFEILKQISIRARFALGLECLINVLKKQGQDLNDWKPVLERLAEFTNSIELDKWLSSARYILPNVVLNVSFENIETLTKEEYLQLRNLFKLQNGPVESIIDELFELGKSDLFGGLVSYSPYTYECLVNIFQITLKVGAPLPLVTPYLKYPISEDFGRNFKMNIDFGQFRSI